MAEQVSNTTKVVKGISSQTLVTIVLGVVEIVSFSIMSRLLTKEDFGYFAAITAITNIFGTFSEMGIGSAIVQQKELTKRYINNAFTISLLFGGFVSSVLLVFAGPLSRFVADESIKIPLMLMACTLVLSSLTSVNNSIMHRRLQFLLMGSINLISLIITTVVAVILAYHGYGYYAIITKAVLGSVISYFLTLYFCKTRFGFSLDKASFKSIFSFSGWLMASSFFSKLSHQVDRLLMPRLLSVSALGEYNRPKDFIEQISSKLNGIFDTALFPVLSGLQDNIRAMKSAYIRSLYLMNIFASLLTLSFMFNSGLLIRIFFGEEWVYLRPVMFVISSSLLFNIDGRLSDCYLRSLGMTKQQFYFRVFEMIIKTLGVLVGFKWGIMGVAVSVVITNFIAKIIKIIYVGNKVQVNASSTIGVIISSWRYMLLILPISILSYVLLPNNWVGSIIIAVIFVVAVMCVFLILPGFVGNQYKEEVHVKIISFLKQKIHKR